MSPELVLFPETTPWREDLVYMRLRRIHDEHERALRRAVQRWRDACFAPAKKGGSDP